MTALASSIRCAGCGYVAGPDEPYPFRCPQAGQGDIDHVLTRVLDPRRVRFPGGAELNPYLRYRALMHSYHLATARWPHRRGLLRAGIRRSTEVGGPGGRARLRGHAVPPEPGLGGPLGFTGGGGVWVKDETGNVSGSHKGRHLMGVLVHLTVVERIGILDRRHRRDLAIASCGNAALAAAVVARAGGWPLRVFVPAGRRRERAAAAARPARAGRRLPARAWPARRPGVPAAAAGTRRRSAAVHDCQGNENGLTIESGETLGYEMVTDLAAPGRRAGPSDRPGRRGSAGQRGDPGAAGGRAAGRAGPAAARAHRADVRRAPARAGLPAGPRDAAGGTRPRGRTRGDGGGRRPAVGVHVAVGEEPKSVAGGILDDETYDWRAVVEGMLLTGGRPVVVSEDLLVEANSLAVALTGIPVDPTGSSGLAGLLALRRSGVIGEHDQVAILFTGVQR